jgi:hypothetical protein
VTLAGGAVDGAVVFFACVLGVGDADFDGVADGVGVVDLSGVLALED